MVLSIFLVPTNYCW